ncbi:hypothetical protein [Roseateles sp.]|uniref:hypothetical protein n=1 Tax=Roseateles sp. TaxID=1971397 RepID=UPI00286BEF3D|nr:hypothetical protein [Roseateles sp.]
MNRLHAELHRLYASHALATGTVAPAATSLVDAGGCLRAALLELAGPADWTALSALWRGVQADLDLPAPAIAVTGVDGYQLWFSFAEPLPLAQASAFVEALRRRYLADVAPQRLRLMAPQALFMAMLPPRQTQVGSEHWSAFVAPDLAPVFAAEPWLDVPPSPEGQADLLCRLESIRPADLRAALLRLGAAASAAPSSAPSFAASLDPESFLLKVINDESVAMVLRIDAAKALLQAKK